MSEPFVHFKDPFSVLPFPMDNFHLSHIQVKQLPLIVFNKQFSSELDHITADLCIRFYQGAIKYAK
jgi:hypothetical protein